MDRLNLAVGAVLLLVCGTAVLSQVNRSVTTSDTWFEDVVLKREQPIVVKFGAEWCGPCRRMDAALDNLQGQFPGAAFLRIDIDEKPQLFQDVSSGGGIPQVMIFKNGQVTALQRGFPGEARMKQWLTEEL